MKTHISSNLHASVRDVSFAGDQAMAGLAAIANYTKKLQKIMKNL